MHEHESKLQLGLEDLIPVNEPGDILPEYRGTPVGDLLAYHNLDESFRTYNGADLLIGTCMDYRILFRMPPKFAYVIRTGGANMTGLDFQISFAASVGGVQGICVIGHDQCAMCGLTKNREKFVDGLVERAGWNRAAAEEHYGSFASRFEIGDSVEFTTKQASYFRAQYPKLTVAPLIYRLDDSRLYQIEER